MVARRATNSEKLVARLKSWSPDIFYTPMQLRNLVNNASAKGASAKVSVAESIENNEIHNFIFDRSKKLVALRATNTEKLVARPKT